MSRKTQEIKMIKLLKEIYNAFITTKRSALEAYIVSKNPQSEADVNYWTQEFYRKNNGWL